MGQSPAIGSIMVSAPIIKKSASVDYQYIETAAQLEQFAEVNQNITWLGFDTEFVTERRFYPMLCLIQVITEYGIYLIDPIALPQLDPFLAMIQDDKITKITHAGENDYRILHSGYGIYPRNLFDTQVAMGFVSHVYPMSFQNVVERELGITLNKSFSVTDWEARPMSPEQINYALNDVLHLPQLWKSLTTQLERSDRLTWCAEEVAKFTTTEYYAPESLREQFKSTTHTQLPDQERVFFVRLTAWRLAEAQKRNVPQEMILPKKMTMPIVKGMNQGLGFLKQNRMISDKLILNHGKVWEKLYRDPMTTEERAALEDLPQWKEETPEQVMTAEFLYLLIRDRCFKAGIANSIVVSKSSFRSQAGQLGNGWRRELLGDSLIEWIQSDRLMSLVVEADRCVVQFGD
jgi:ribonuclease D